jgi:hypothetical protein
MAANKLASRLTCVECHGIGVYEEQDLGGMFCSRDCLARYRMRVLLNGHCNCSPEKPVCAGQICRGEEE